MNVADDLRQLVSPGEDQTRKLQQTGGTRQRLSEINRCRQSLVEIAAIVIGFTERADDGEDRRATAEQVDEFDRSTRTARRVGR